ncbi:DUF3579 domain-containing protein [Paraburkholderia sp. MPAMCS5]|uniref:DUF3579 domain-containing protein n=1 Tax=Paraburkholderia sp. MPAMCS5 TaxID=3112563 RepID=UPI002E19CBE6|nr:DUF3579 domain-containing protein [Paraburkholderia sp. MPAMCS5]
MTSDGVEHFLIRGVTSQRKVFRPGDWAERLSGVIALFVSERCPDKRGVGARLAMPVVMQDVKCLRIAYELRHLCPDAFDFVMRFASDNDLSVDVFTLAHQKHGQDISSVT